MASEAQGEETGLVFHPMDQFVVKPLFGGDTVMWYTPTNVTLWMALTVLAVFALLVFGTSRRAMIPTRMQSSCLSCFRTFLACCRWHLPQHPTLL